jgi:hypothetical protein
MLRSGGTQGMLVDLSARKAERLRYRDGRADPRLNNLRSRRQTVLTPHASQAFSHCVQGSGCRAARVADDSPRAPHLYQPCIGGRADAGRGARRRGARQREHHEWLSACRGGRRFRPRKPLSARVGFRRHHLERLGLTAAVRQRVIFEERLIEARLPGWARPFAEALHRAARGGGHDVDRLAIELERPRGFWKPAGSWPDCGV